MIGGLTAVFAGKKKKDTFVGILEAYPTLIERAVDGTESLNVELAQALLAGGQLDEETKKLVENTLEWQKAMEEAKEAITGVIKDLAGSLGDDLRNGLVNSFKAGEDAAKAFGDSVAKVLENIVSQLLFNQLFAQDFKNLEDRMKASFTGPDADNNFVDDLVDFYQTAGPKAKEFAEGLQAAKDELAKQGIDVFAGPGGTKADPNSLSGAIQGMSQETAGLLAGQFNALRISGAEVALNTRTSLLHLTEIASNTRYNRHLESIDNTLREMKNNDPTRPLGLPK